MLSEVINNRLQRKLSILYIYIYMPICSRGTPLLAVGVVHLIETSIPLYNIDLDFISRANFRHYYLISVLLENSCLAV